jgi:hypothetical protein
MLLDEAVGVTVLRYVEQEVTVMTVGSARPAEDEDVLGNPWMATDEAIGIELKVAVLLVLGSPYGAGMGPTGRR